MSNADSGHAADSQSPQPRSAQDQAFDEFVARMNDEGASPEAALQAAQGHAALEARRMPPGQTLPGPTARWWQHAFFVMLGVFLAVLGSVAFTAPAFHPSESQAESSVWGGLFLATFFPVIVIFVGAGVGMYRKQVKEMRKGYTTLRWTTVNNTEVRDSHGAIIPPGDPRLSGSAKAMHAFVLIAGPCALVSPLLWILRTILRA